MKQRLIVAGALGLCLSLSAAAAPIVYDVTVNTSTIAGTAGSLDFNFNPGPSSSQPASLQIQDFTSDGALGGTPTVTGDVSGGPLSATLTFDNATALNDYFEGFTFGHTLSFDVSLYGAALSAPNGTAAAGSAFAFSMFSDAAGTVPVLTSDTTNGFAVVVNVNLDGSTTVSNSSAETIVSASASAVPEPGTLAGLALAMGLALVVRLRRGVVAYSHSPAPDSGE